MYIFLALWRKVISGWHKRKAFTIDILQNKQASASMVQFISGSSFSTVDEDKFLNTPNLSSTESSPTPDGQPHLSLNSQSTVASWMSNDTAAAEFKANWNTVEKN